MKQLIVDKAHRKTILFTYKSINDPDKIIEVDLHYDIGGMSYMSGRSTKRGYRLSVQPTKVSRSTMDDGRVITWRTFGAYTGTYKLIAEANAYSEPKLIQLAGRMNESSWEDILQSVIARNGWAREEFVSVNDDTNSPGT